MFGNETIQEIVFVVSGFSVGQNVACRNVLSWDSVEQREIWGSMYVKLDANGKIKSKNTRIIEGHGGIKREAEKFVGE